MRHFPRFPDSASLFKDSLDQFHPANLNLSFLRLLRQLLFTAFLASLFLSSAILTFGPITLSADFVWISFTFLIGWVLLRSAITFRPNLRSRTEDADGSSDPFSVQFSSQG